MSHKGAITLGFGISRRPQVQDKAELFHFYIPYKSRNLNHSGILYLFWAFLHFCIILVSARNDKPTGIKFCLKIIMNEAMSSTLVLLSYAGTNKYLYNRGHS